MPDATEIPSSLEQLRQGEPRLAAELAGRVTRGARLLDFVEPGWHARIAVDRLAMERCDRCILGQLYGGYREGFRAILAPLPNSQLYPASKHGFTLSSFEQDPYEEDIELIMLRFAALADLWRREVRSRAPLAPSPKAD